jgi:hypothetical protein
LGCGVGGEMMRGVYRYCEAATLGIVLSSFLWMFSTMPYFLKFHPDSPQTRGDDVRIIYEAVYHGIPKITGENIFVYVYPENTLWVWGWMRLFELYTCVDIMLGVSLFAYIILIHQVFKMPFGWAVILISLKPVLLLLWSGNVQIILFALCLSPFTIPIAVAFKFYFVGVAVVYAAGWCYGRRVGTNISRRLFGYDSPVIHSRAAWVFVSIALIVAFKIMWLK